MGDAKKGSFRVHFNRRIKLEFHGAKVLLRDGFTVLKKAPFAVSTKPPTKQTWGCYKQRENQQ